MAKTTSTKTATTKKTTTKRTTKKTVAPATVEKKKILFVTSEAQPFAASGGLADVAGSLPKALAKDPNVDVRVVMPLYSIIPDAYKKEFKYVGNTQLQITWRSQYLGLFEYKKDNVTWYFLDNEYYFKRNSIYGYFDEAERFTFLSRGALEILPMINFIPNIIHCQDWESALIPVYLKTLYSGKETYKHIRTLYTIHNMEYQGRYGKSFLYDLFELSDSDYSLVEYDNDINLMKGAIQCADIVSTVSPTYAKEILTPSAAHGLEHINKANEYKMTGILNGIDYDFYNPETDANLAANYNADNLEGKAKCKEALQDLLGLDKKDVPVIAMITRLVSHKGIDLLEKAFDRLLEKDVQIIVLGTGEFGYEEYFKDLERRHKFKVRALIQYNGALSRKIYAGADIFLMPSKNEPCGLSQMIAARYGTIPVVRKVGGLNDSITDVGDDGIGYTFITYDSTDMYMAINRAIDGYKNKEKWQQTVIKAMNTDFSWSKSADEYIKIYDRLLEDKI